MVMVRVGEGIEGGVVGKLGRQVRVWSKGLEMVMVGRPPVVRACEVGRKMD